MRDRDGRWAERDEVKVGGAHFHCEPLLSSMGSGCMDCPHSTHASSQCGQRRAGQCSTLSSGCPCWACGWHPTRSSAQLLALELEALRSIRHCNTSKALSRPAGRKLASMVPSLLQAGRPCLVAPQPSRGRAPHLSECGVQLLLYTDCLKAVSPTTRPGPAFPRLQVGTFGFHSAHLSVLHTRGN